MRVLVRKERWTLTTFGKLLFLALLFIGFLTVRLKAHSFLALNDPRPSEMMILEGWVPENVLSQAAAEFKHGGYQQLLIVRASYGSRAGYFPGLESKEFVARILGGYDVSERAIGVLFYPAAQRDRTYHAALAAKAWLAASGSQVKTINVVTVGPHARRSRLLFQKTFGNAVDVGVVALVDPEYDYRHWWRTSEGVRETLGESIAYVYARLFLIWN